MKKILLITGILMAFIACKNAPETAPENLSIASTEDGKVVLKIKPKTGETLRMKMDVDLAMDVKEMGEPMKSHTEMEMTLKVKEAKDTLYYYETKFDHIKVKTGVQGISFTYDSDGNNTGPAAMIHKELNPLLEEPMEFTMSELGHVYDVSWGEVFNDKNLDMSAISLPLPQQPVGVGDSWNAIKDMQQMEGAKAELNMTVEKITADEVYISVKGGFAGENEQDSADISGTYILDRETCFTKNGEITFTTSQPDNSVTATTVFKAL